MAFIAESSRMVTVTRSGLGEAESAREKKFRDMGSDPILVKLQAIVGVSTARMREVDIRGI